MLSGLWGGSTAQESPERPQPLYVPLYLVDVGVSAGGLCGDGSGQGVRDLLDAMVSQDASRLHALEVVDVEGRSAHVGERGGAGEAQAGKGGVLKKEKTLRSPWAFTLGHARG